MASSSQHVTVGLDTESKRYMTRLTTAIDALAKAINNGEKVDKDLISEPVVQRLVEDAVKTRKPNPAVIESDGLLRPYPGKEFLDDETEKRAGRKTSDGQPLPDDESYYRDADGRLKYNAFKGDWSTRD